MGRWNLVKIFGKARLAKFFVNEKNKSWETYFVNFEVYYYTLAKEETFQYDLNSFIDSGKHL